MLKITRGGLDKMAKNTYIYYSGPTDDTGKRIADALGAQHGKVKPAGNDSMVVIGWGCKTKDRVALKQHSVINHPDFIRTNRNKFETLKVLENSGVPVAAFADSDGIIATLDNDRSVINLPVVGRRKFHQGGKGFWACLTKGQVRIAIQQGAEYFQNYLHIVDEYRLHVFQGKIINMQKKVQRNNMTRAYQEQHGTRIANIADKNKVNLDKQTMDYVLENLGKREERPDQIIKSNTRGWKFSQIKTVKTELKEAAINAVKAIGLDFGAVDCCIVENGNPYIIEVNTGPGLQGTSFDAYVKTFKDAIAAINKPAVKKTVTAASSKAAPVGKTVGASVTGGPVKRDLAAKAAFMSEMIANADEDEAAALQSVLKKMWG
jgi:glutathione synthase/RimK-type ligase-like ATP-grasp enzyme